MINLGDRNCGQTVYVPWNTHAVAGESITMATNPTISVYKDMGLTQSTAGVGSLSEDFDGLTGAHGIPIDTLADASFYSSGGTFWVVASGAVIDGKTINKIIAVFTLNHELNKLNQSMGRKRAIYVKAQGGSNSNNGHSPEAALATIAQANTNSERGDTIVLLPAGDGSATFHPVSTGITFKEGVEIVGQNPHTTRVAFSGLSSYFSATSRLNIRNVGLDGTSATPASGLIFFQGTSTRTVIRLENCVCRSSTYAAFFHSSSSNQLLELVDTFMEGGVAGILNSGAATNIIRTQRGTIRGDNSLAGSPDNVSAIYATQGQLYLNDTALEAISWSSNIAHTLDVLNFTASGIVLAHVNGGSMNMVAVAAVLTTQRHVYASGSECQVRLGAIARKDSDALLVEASGGTIDKLSTTANIPSVVDANIVSAAANVITSTAIQDGALTNAKLADGILTSAKIAADAITSAKIATDAIGADELAASAIAEIVAAFWTDTTKFTLPGALTPEAVTVLKAITKGLDSLLGKHTPTGATSGTCSTMDQSADSFDYTHGENSRTPTPGSFTGSF